MTTSYRTNKNRKIKYISSATFMAVMLCSLLLPSPANAISYASGTGVWDCALSPIDCVLNFTRSLLASLIALTGSGVNAALTAPIANVPVVASSWNIVRGFSNMFFILALIIMAFATIFSISKYEFRNLIAKFLIAALLINFSLVIGEVIIDWSQSLSNVFLQAIGDVGARIAQGANIAKNFSSAELTNATTPIDQVTWGETMVAGVSVIMLSILLFSLVVLLFFSIIRIPILWALLIISPIAWITYILPTTTDVNRRWWKYFIGWNVFTPIYLFFIYFGTLFLSRQDEVLSSTSGPLISGFNTAFQDIFFYILIGIFLIGGAKAAMSASMAAGAGGVAAGIWARGRTTARFAGTRIPFIPVGRPRILGGAGMGMSNVQNISGAAAQRWEQTKREGVLGIGGSEAAERRQSLVADRFGVRGAGQEQIQRNIQLSEQKFRKAGLNEAALNAYLTNPDGTPNTESSPEQRIAAANILKGQFRTLRGDEVKRLYEDYKGLSPAEAAKWVRGQKDAIEGLAQGDLDELEETADPQMKQFIARIKAKRDIIKDEDEWSKKIKLFEISGNDATMASFIGEGKEFIERLEVTRAMELMEKIPKANKESIKKYATLIAKKGITNDKLIELTERAADGKFVGAFESESEVSKFLDLAKEANIEGALSAKLKAGVLMDLDTKEKTNDIDKVLEQEFKQMTPKEMASQIFRRDDTDPSKQIGLSSDKVQAALQRMLEKSKSQRLEDFYKSDEFISSPHFAYIDPVITKVRETAFETNLYGPVKEAAAKITSLVPQIKTAKDSGDTSTADGLLLDAKTALTKLKRLRLVISESKVAKDNIKEQIDRLLVDSENKVREAEIYKKDRGGN